jgi:hypothetical protein
MVLRMVIERCLAATLLVAVGCATSRRDGPTCGSFSAWPVPAEVIVPRDSTSPTFGDWYSTAAILDGMATSLEMYCRVRGSYPENLDQLRDLDPSEYGRLCEPVDVLFSDAWNKELRYEVRRGAPSLWSAGPDGTFGTADDIRAPRPGDKGSVPLNLSACGDDTSDG